MAHSLHNRIFAFTDLHFGVHSNNPSYIQICSDTLKWVSEYCSENSIDDVLFLGDFFDSRASIDVKTLNSATQSLYELADSGVSVTMVLGNHDIYLRDSTAIHSLLAFGGRRGIRIVDTPETVEIEGVGKTALLLPWMYGTPSKRVEVPTGTGWVFAHHNFPTNFFMGGAFQRKRNRSDTYVSKTPYEDDYGIQQDLMETLANNGGTFFSGHIHQGKTIPLRDSFSDIVIMGSPYETSWGFDGFRCGGYVIDFAENTKEFVDNPFNKRHVEIRTSDAEKDMEGVDFANSIVRLNVDTQESFDTISKLQSKINSMKPFAVENTKYEFTVAEFVGNRDESVNPLDSIGMKVSSKLDYILNAIDRGDFAAFDYMDGVSENAVHVDKERLRELASELFEKGGKRNS